MSKLEITPQVAHTGSVRSVAFSPNGRQLLSAGGTTVKLWDTATGALLRTFKGHSGAIYAAVFSPDGSRVASCSDDTTVKLWDAATGALLHTFEEEDSITSVMFSPDGKQLLLGSFGTLTLRDAVTGVLLRTIKGHSGYVSSIVFSQNGSRILSGGQDRTAKLWDAATGRLLHTFEEPGEVTSVTFSPDGKQLLLGSFGTLTLRDAVTGALLRTIKGHEGQVAVAFSPDGTQLLSGGFDGTLKLWGAASGALLRTVEAEDLALAAVQVAFSPDGKQLLSGRDTLKLWDDTTGALLRSIGQDQLQKWFAEIRARKSVLIFDTCESGTLTNGEQIALNTRSLGAEEAQVAAVGRLIQATGRTTLTAAIDDQSALEGYRGHGVFTFALLDGLAHGDRNGNGLVEVTELLGHVDELVPEITEKTWQVRQIPRSQFQGSDFALIKQVVALAPAPGEDLIIATTPTHVVTELVDVLKDENATAAIVQKLQPFTTVTLIRSGQGWALIAKDGRALGYVASDKLHALQ